MKPAGMVIVGIIGMMLFGWGTYDDIFSPPPRPLLESEVSYFRGRSSTAQAVPMGYGFVNFRVWLVDHPVAFQSAIHAGSKTFDIKVFKQLGPESEITIGVETSGLNAPGLDRRSNQKFLPFVSLESDKKSFSSLADYNERKNKGDESGLFHPILLVISMVTFGLGLLALLQGRSRMAG